VLYQEGTLPRLMHPDDLAALAKPALRNGTLMFCGTFAAIGGVRPTRLFRYQLEDPVLGRAIDAAYGMRTLPLVS
jgi:hypothetical protein